MRDRLTVPKELIDFLHRYSTFLVVGHKDPDGDCIGSQLALGALLERLEKRVILANPGPFERQEIAAREDSFRTTLTAEERSSLDAVVVVDCSSADRIGEIAQQIRELPLAVIDHHTTGEQFGDLHFIRPEIPATTVLVHALYKAMKLQPTQDEAQQLFFGLVTDTGFFRFLNPEQHHAYTVAAELTGAGASPREADRLISSGRSMESRLLIARLLQRVEQLRDGEFLLTFQTRADEKEFGKRRDSDALYRLLLAVEKVRVIALVKEKEQGCAVSFRATDETHVGELAARLGGGGHQKAAGAFREEQLHTFLPRVRNALLSIDR